MFRGVQCSVCGSEIFSFGWSRLARGGARILPSVTPIPSTNLCTILLACVFYYDYVLIAHVYYFVYYVLYVYRLLHFIMSSSLYAGYTNSVYYSLHISTVLCTIYTHNILYTAFGYTFYTFLAPQGVLGGLAF